MTVKVSAEPAQTSRVKRFVKRIPFVRRLGSHEDAVPPAIRHEATPVLPASIRRAILSEVPIDVKVYVNPSGKVDYAELIAGDATEHRELAALAVYAARKWEFSPATLEGRNVAGEMIVHFRFLPETVASR